MGTPEFAVAPLQELVKNNFNIVGVVTVPDKPSGRGLKLNKSAVKLYAEENLIPNGVKLMQPVSLKDEGFLQELKELEADLFIVVAFRMLPEVVWAMPKMGTFNLHGSLLPLYRGAAPINWAIINGDTETGITTFFLDEQIDTGRIILQEHTPITIEDCAETIHDKLMMQGAELVVKTVRLIESGQAEATDQSLFITEEPLRSAPKIFKDTCRIHWQEHSLRSAYDFIRGLSPYPAAWTPILANGKETEMKIYRASMLPNESSEGKVELLSDGKTYLKISLPGGYLSLEEVQLSGKKRMPIADLLRGTNLSLL